MSLTQSPVLQAPATAPLPSRLSGMPHLEGDPIFGHTRDLLDDKNGTKIGLLVDRAFKRARQHPSEMCSFTLAPGVQAVCLTRSKDIKALFSRSDSKEALTESRDRSGIYPHFFGPNVLLANEGPIAITQRNFFLGQLLGDNLQKREAFSNMQGNIEARFKASEESKEILNLAKFIEDLTLELFSKAQLQWDLNTSEREHIISIVNRMVPEVTRLKGLIYLLLKDKPGFAQALALLNKLISPPMMEIIKKEGQILFESFIKKNENLPSSTHVRSLLEEWRKEKFEDKTGKPLLSDVQFSALVLLAGYESTSKFILFSLMLLTDPQYRDRFLILKKILREDVANGKDPAKNKELEKFVFEVLRLYPPFPLLKDETKRGVCIKDGNREIFIPPGTVIFIPSYQIMRLREEFSQGEDFRPDLVDLESIYSVKNNPYQFLTFGFRRPCPGRFAAISECAQVMSHIILNYDATLKNRKHPYPIDIKFSLQSHQSAGPIDLAITPERPRARL